MNGLPTIITVAFAILSIALGVSGDYLLGGFIGGTILVLGTIANLVGVLLCPHLLDNGANAASVSFFAVPALVLALVFGLMFFAWQWAIVYALFALVAYLVSGFIGCKN